MEIQKKKCSLKDHENLYANIYCKKCEIYMCNKCESYHSKLFSDHQDFIIDKNIEELNNEFCEEENHHYFKLKYYCKTHKKWCCSACIVKIKGKGDGQHMNCEVCNMEDIKKEKNNHIKENSKLLEELSVKTKDAYNNGKKIYDRINENKENLKLKIQKIFTNIRNILNSREDELLLMVDKEYDNFHCTEDIIRDIEKLPDKINSSLEKLKNIDDNNIYKLVNECADIDKNIDTINKINSNLENIYKLPFFGIYFVPEENAINKFIEQLKSFGQIKINNIYDFRCLNESSIIKDDIKNIFLIANWIKETIQKEKIKLELIFRMSENGTKANDFHKYCDNKGPTLTLVKTTENKIFGGFTPLNWKSEKESFIDDDNFTFIFSLDLKKKFHLLDKKKEAIYCEEDSGPCFGDSDFCLYENMKNGVTFANNSCNFLHDNNLELVGEKGESANFQTEELEIYKLIY
jgi:hypothetical protein